MKRIAFALACCVALSSLPLSAAPFQIFPLDIFKNDSIMRTVPDEFDLRWTVDLGGCTGSMLSPKYVLSASHCAMRVGARYTSGGCLILGCRNDLQVVAVTEDSASLDSTIAEVKWLRKDTRWKQRYTPRVQLKENDIEVGRDGQGTKLFTVGFPGDKNRAMIAVGYAKGRDGNNLLYNVGSINGNSGGAVWTFDDYTLVSQTNFGTHALNQKGWNNNDPEDRNAWNGGPQMYKVYNQSRVMQTIFPRGVNYNVSFEGFLIRDSELPPLDP